jgi:Protein of unknown function DUF262
VGFQPPITVAKALSYVHSRQYVLPAIQREFIWSPSQICLLFDSLLRRYPIGSFLFWEVDAEQAQEFRFYDFLTDYHERRHPYAALAHIPPGHRVTAVLDGQQRLTALNVGIYGSHAERLPRKWANNPEAYPTKRLYLDLLHGGSDEEELAAAYRFKFLTKDEAAGSSEPARGWFKVADVLAFKDSGPDMVNWLRDRGLLERDGAYDRLYALYKAIHEQPALNAYVEEDQDPGKVLDIFVRVNSGGTVLSYSDLLLSMATNQWNELDAREEVRTLVTELNSGSREFSFTKDNVLKAGLVLTEVPDVGFKVSNFTKNNMAEMEKQWPSIKAALLLTVKLLSSFGFTSRTLSANSVMIPLAYYIYRQHLGENYLTSAAAAGDRARVRQWVTRSLIKRNIWGAGLDTLLSRLRQVLRQAPEGEFPTDGLDIAMADLGKPLQFTDAEISDVAELQYPGPRTFAILAMLYPGLDLSQDFHIDHIFPKSWFTRSRLRKAGIAEDQLDIFIDLANGLPNLQLLPGLPNIEKQDKAPWTWLDTGFPSAQAKEHYIVQNDLDLLPEDLMGFPAFCARRKERLERRLRGSLGVTAEHADGRVAD